MKIKNAYFILLAFLLVFSACTDELDSEPLLDEVSDQIIAPENSTGGYWENELKCTTITTGNTTEVLPGSCFWEVTWVELDGSGGSTGGSGGTNKKFKGNKDLTDCGYFTPSGYTCTDMVSFQRGLFHDMSDAEWVIFLGMTKAQRSKYVLNARLAIDKANQFFSGWERNGKGDALRQGIASALNAKDLGVSLTQQLQTANGSVGYDAKELQMKNNNEAFGRGLILPYGPTLSANTLCNMVIYARANGGLLYITNLNSFNRPTGSSLVVTTSDAQTPPGDDCPPGGDEGPGGGGMPIGTC